MKSHRAIAESVGENCANEMFKLLSNPINQGPNFKMEHLPEMAAKMASASLLMAFSKRPAKLETLKKTAYDKAFAAAKKLVERNRHD